MILDMEHVAYDEYYDALNRYESAQSENADPSMILEQFEELEEESLDFEEFISGE